MRKLFYYIIFFGCYLSFSSMIFAQSQLGKGVVILNNEEVIFGIVDYHQEYEMVSVTRNGKELAYNATQVKIFQYYDQEKSLNRIYRPFIASSITRYAFLDAPEFFEMVLLDDVTILRKMKTIIIDPNPENDKSPTHVQDILPRKAEAIDYDYYVSIDGMEASLIKNFQRQVIDKLPSIYHASLTQFVAENNLYLKNWTDQFELLEYYQQIKENASEGPAYYIAEPIKL